jgi:hypothetical protein
MEMKWKELTIVPYMYLLLISRKKRRRCKSNPMIFEILGDGVGDTSVVVALGNNDDRAREVEARQGFCGALNNHRAVVAPV